MSNSTLNRTDSQTATQLDAALALADKGFNVFHVWGINGDGSCTCGNAACENIGKHPVEHGGHTKATRNPLQLQLWWNRPLWRDNNIGLATGQDSGVIVLDVDGELGRDTLGNRAIPPTVTAITGRHDGGRHYFFKHPGGNLRNFKGSNTGLPGLDFRGDGGYVVAAPSIHRSGNAYAWEPGKSPWDMDPADPPEWLLALIHDSGEVEAKGPGDPETVAKLRDLTRRHTNLERIVPTNNGTVFRLSRCPTAPIVNGEPAHAGGAWFKVFADGGTRFACWHNGCQGKGLTDALEALGEAPEPFKTFSLLDFRRNDTGNAERLAALFGDRIRWLSEAETFLVWTGTHWSRRDNLQIERYAKEMLQELFRAAMAYTGEDRKEWLAFASKSGNSREIEGMIRRLKAVAGIEVKPEELDADPWLFNVANGTLDLRDGELYEHDPADLITRVSPVAFDPSATAPRWLQFLSETMPAIAPTPPDPDDPDDKGEPGRTPEAAAALVGYLQRLTGYAMTGSTKEQSLSFLYGNGKNGKSTFINAFTDMLGKYATVVDAGKTLMQQRNPGVRTDLARLEGARFVVSSEISQGGKLDEAMIKTLTGGDTVTARYLYGREFEYRPAFTLVMYGNHKPTIAGTDEGIWRRVHLIPFTHEVSADKRDANLGDKLAKELPGILNWALAGCLDWQRQGLNPPEEILAATREYRQEMDTIGQFLDECCTVGEGLKAEAGDLFRAYTAWEHDRNTRAPKTVREFGLELGKHGIEKKKSGSTVWRTGLKLNNHGALLAGLLSPGRGN